MALAGLRHRHWCSIIPTAPQRTWNSTRCHKCPPTTFDFSTKKRDVVKPTCDGRLVSSSFNVEGAIDGSLAVGGFVEVGLTVGSRDISKLCFRGELGAEMVGYAVLYSSDVASASHETLVYERKNSKIAYNVV